MIGPRIDITTPGGTVALVAAVAVVLCGLSIPAGAATPQLPGELPDTGAEEGPEVQTHIDDEDEEQLEGRRIVGYHFHCDLELCQQPAAVQRFQRISGIAEGDIYRQSELQRAHQRLAKTGFFRQLTVERTLESDGVVITIDAVGAVLIRRVSFEGSSPPPFERELRNVLMYRPGQVFVDSDEQAAAQRSSLEALFEQEGYFGTEITMKPQQVEGHPHLVDLMFEVQPGQRRRICAMGFRGLRAMTSAEARELMLAGTSVIARRIPLMLPRFTSDQFRNGRDALIEEYRRRGYFRARIVDQAVQIDEATNCVRLVLDVNEGPYWEIEFDGNQAVSGDELRGEMPFARSGFVDDNEIEQAEHSVRKLYESRGYPFAIVRGREEASDQFDRRIEFSIQEGPRVQIERMRFHGMELFDDAEALEQFGTRSYGLFDAGGFLQTEQLLADFARLEQRYRDRGYLQAVVDRFVVELNDRGDGITIWVYVNEGEPTQVDQVQVSGNSNLDLQQLQQQLEVGEGSPFVPLEVQADQSRLSRHYGTRGYPEATVSTSCHTVDGRRVDCAAPELPDQCKRTSFQQLSDEGCQWRQGATATLVCDRTVRSDDCQFEGGVVDERVSVHHQIREGAKAEVGEILLKGNFRTRSGVIFRELPLETGDVLDVQKLLEGQGNMRSLGLFDSVSIETIGLDEQPSQGEDAGGDGDGEVNRSVPLVVSVEESRSRFVDLRFGVEGRQLLDESRRLLATGELQYIDDNLFGTGQRFRPRLIGATDTLELGGLAGDTATDPAVAGDVTGLDYLFGAELIYSHPRFLRGQTGIDKLFLTVTPFYLIDLLGVSTETETVLREEWGLRLDLRKELVELMDRLYVRLGAEAKQAATWARGDLRVEGERIFSPRRATGKLMPELTLDRRDSPLNPGEGFHLQFQPELVSGDALAQGGEELIDDSYWRLSFSASHFIPLTDGLTLGQGVEFGQVVPLFDRQRLVPLDERYYMGGVGSVRGFPRNSLGPVGQREAEGGEFLLNYNAELRYPLMEDWGLYGATFFDAGVLVNCLDGDDRRTSGQCYRNAFPADRPLGEVRAAGGLGLRYLLVDQIPVLLDYAMVLNRRPSEGFGSLHFNLGYTF